MKAGDLRFSSENLLTLVCNPKWKKEHGEKSRTSSIGRCMLSLEENQMLARNPQGHTKLEDKRIVKKNPQLIYAVSQ